MLELRGSGAEPLEAGDPRLIGSIPLAGRLGAGGMGRVYLGVQDGRYVAVKQLLSSVVGEDADFLRRFGHELDNLSRLPAEATAPLLDSDRTAMPPWFATAYIPGVTLREALALHGGPLPAQALWLLLREAAAGLAAVHALDMVHRDLKPSNVMLTLDGLTLIDFGVARAAEQSRLTRTGMVVGTPAYMAPEQASGRRRPRSAIDVFALGSVLAYAACGEPPFGDESGHGVLYRIVHEEPDLEPLREVEPELAELVATCLDKDPEGRPSAAELLERASRQGPFTRPLWPAAVTERLADRAAFAAHVQEIDVPTVPLAGPKPGAVKGRDPKAGPTAGPDSAPTPGPQPQPQPQPGPEAVPGPRTGDGSGPRGTDRPRGSERPDRRRRTRVLLAVVPVVVVAGGTTLALQHLPYTTAPGARAQATPSASLPAPSAPAPAGGAGPSGAASPGQSPAVGQAEGNPPDQGPGTAGGVQVPAAGGAGAGSGPGSGPGAGPGTGAGSGPGAGPGSGGQNGPGNPAGAGGAGGTRPSAPSGGGTTAPAPPPASGTYRYRNGNNGSCVTQVFGASDHGDCSDASARWTVQGRPDGSFKLVNKQSGQCLYSNGLGQAVFVGDCAQDTGRLWRAGSGGSLRSDYGGGCLDLGMSGGLLTKTCGGEASQRWTRQA
ncbi:serine/threonine protein kinase [Streptomyces sp. CB00455]|uniref:serine/threonine-protein kinase n=1 Tax=Streptomyces sp. CB00455 TaxID=1703927 RepID=UPI00093E08A6|nr:serine/threonine-protein kinase [Streptomyces sp. CB00455]OKK22020.1 serine/threonine protein kinase [Streptomyces sp. CB00455]